VKRRSVNLGSSNNESKLFETGILLIFELSEGGLLQREIAEVFDVDPSVISKVLARKIWRHVRLKGEEMNVNVRNHVAPPDPQVVAAEQARINVQARLEKLRTNAQNFLTELPSPVAKIKASVSADEWQRLDANVKSNSQPASVNGWTAQEVRSGEAHQAALEVLREGRL
jgi:hypothetical protein